MPTPKFDIVTADAAYPERSLTPAKIIAAVQAPEKGQRIYWIKGGVPLGFGLLVRPTTTARKGLNATWVVQADDPRGVGVRLKIARYEDMPVKAVIKRAIELRTQIQDGTHRERKAAVRAKADRNAFTVGDAFRLWVEHLEQHARPSTIRDAVGKGGSSSDIRGGYIKKHFSDWLTKPLAELTKPALVTKHRDITKDSGDRTANKVLKALRTAWNCALDLYEELPRNLLAGRKAFKWNHEPEGGPLVTEDELAQWWRDVHRLSPVLRDYYLVTLFTGARAMEVASMRWVDVKLERGIVHFPEPKGGPKKAYTVPVATFVLDLLRARFAASLGSKWVFPSRTKPGAHISKTCLTKKIDGKRVRIIASPHMLRRTMITAADDLISAKQAEKLVNHGGKSNSAHGRYIIPGEAKLRAAAERLAEYLLEKAGATAAIHGIQDARRSTG